MNTQIKSPDVKSRGPVKGSFTTISSVSTAQDKWNGTAPDWIMMLAQECDRTSQGATARLIGFSGAYVSNLINNKFKGDLNALKKAVKGALMAQTVDCPGAQMNLAGNVCLAWQKKTQKFRVTSPLSLQMYRACKGDCRHSRVGKNNTGGNQ